MIEFKRGATFEAEISLTDEDGLPVVTDVTNLRAELRKSNSLDLVTELNIESTDVLGTYKLTSPISTEDWTIGKYSFDVRLEIDEVIRYSETFDVNVVKSITRLEEEDEE